MPVYQGSVVECSTSRSKPQDSGAPESGRRRGSSPPMPRCRELTQSRRCLLRVAAWPCAGTRRRARGREQVARRGCWKYPVLLPQAWRPSAGNEAQRAPQSL